LVAAKPRSANAMRIKSQLTDPNAPMTMPTAKVAIAPSFVRRCILYEKYVRTVDRINVIRRFVIKSTGVYLLVY
jgi:hypothetical protein